LEHLRDLLYERPHEAVWRQLIAALAAEPDPGTQAIAADYADGTLEAWPYLLRVAPRPWWAARQRGEQPPAWRLARALDLSAGAHRDKDAEAFARSLAMEELPALLLRDAGLAGAELRTWLTRVRSAHLTALDLSANPLRRAPDVAAIAESALDHLDELRLRACPLEADAFAQLGAPGFMPSLRRLDVSARRMTRDDLRLLWSGGGPLGLDTLVLEDAGIDELVSEAFAAAPGPARLRHLHLADNALTGGGLWALAEGPLLPRLATLDLARNGLFWRDIRALATLADEGRLERLVLDGNDIEDAGATFLAGWRAWSGARLVSLRACRIADPGALALADAPWLPGLEELDLGDNEVGETGKEALKAVLGMKVRF